MEDTRNDKSVRSGIFSPLLNEEPSVTLAELKQHISVSSVASIFSFRFPTIVLTGIAITGVGLFFALHNNRSPISHTENIETRSAQQKTSPHNETAITPLPTTAISRTIASHSVRNEKVNTKLHLSLEKDFASENNTQPLIPESNTIPQRNSNPNNNLDISPSKDSSVTVAKALASVLSGDDLLAIRNASQSRYRIFGALQAGVIISSLNTSGGGIAVSFDHDWQHVGFRYSSTFGTKDNSSELFRKLNPVPNGATAVFPNYQYTQNVIEYTIQFGATIKEGNFWTSFSAGPNYTNSSAFTSYIVIINKPPTPQFFIPQYGTISTGNLWKGLGASAEAKIGYKFGNYWGTEITGFVSDHSQIAYGGILFSVVFGIL